MGVAHETLQRVIDLYREGQYLKAYAAGETLGPLEDWPGTEARIMAGRLATMLGAPRVGRILHRLAWRGDRSHPEAVYFNALTMYLRRGPWETWQFLERHGDLPEAPLPIVADWYALRGQVLAGVRDFESAEAWITKAEEAAPERPWISVERAVVLEAEDRHEAALEAARKALALRPWFRPAVQAAAHYLVQLNRDEEALALLREAAQRLESGDVILQLAALQTELGRFTEARENFERAVRFLPLLSRDKERFQMVTARRCDAAYYCEDLDEAVRLAALVDRPFFKEVAQRLAVRPLTGRRVLLPVGFVHQHHVTCAPATLAAISQYWSKPADHLEVAEKICYDGTPAHSERRWAEESGFIVREFRITWESALMLLDRGIPFALHTVDPGTAHLQAAIGYDSRRGTLILRDPSERHFGEVLADKMIEHYRSTGPRGVALVPGERADLLDRIELPDEKLYDDYYAIERSLQVHQREKARDVHNRMRSCEPDHQLTLRARWTLANYDADLTNVLHHADLLLAQFPDDANLLATKLNCLRELGRREDRVALLQKICANPDSHPLFWLKYAQELSDDAREYEEVLHLLKRTLRCRPADADGYGLLADVLWDRQRRDEALMLYRFAACLDDKDESRAKAYFVASRNCRQTQRALDLLKDRFDRFGTRSGWPPRTLCWAYEQLEQVGKVFQVLDQAMQLRPDDGDLLLSAADLYGRYGRKARADELLRQAADASHRTSWLRTAAYLAIYRGDQAAALGYARQVVEAEPLARDANDLVAQLLADLAGDQAAIQHLRGAVERFPRSYALRVLLIEWLRREDSAVAEAAVRELLDLQPVDPWARRELVIALIEQGKWDEAGAEAELACQLEPNSPVVHFAQGRIHQACGRTDEARAAFRRAIRLSVDYEPAIPALMAICNGKAEREEELHFLTEELVRQVIFGDGLLTFRDCASATLDPPTLLGTLREALAVRPDLWHAHAAMIRQLLEVGQTDEALDLARTAVERFPLLPRMWVELAAVCRARKDAAGEVEALEKALEIAPNWGEAARQLAEVHQRNGDLQQAAALLEQTIAREPRDARNYGFLADALWELDRREEALDRLAQAVQMEPGYEWAWNTLLRRSAEMDRPELAVDLARELTRLRPHQARSWIVLARVLQDDQSRHERLEALDRAVVLNPRHAEAHGMRAECLSEMGRFDDAMAACRPAAFGDDPPLDLAARAADVESRRGDLPAAIAAMRHVTAQDPDYFWAWTRLADWHEQTGQKVEYLEAAENMVRLAPHNVVCWGYRGDARLRHGDRAGACQDFQHAMEMAPDYSFAPMSLFDAQLEDGDLDGAARTLEAASPHMPREHSLTQQICLASRRGDFDAAIEHLEALCATPMKDASPLERSVAAMLKNDWRRAAIAILGRHLDQPTTNPEIGAVWVGLAVAGGWWNQCRKRLDALADRGELWCLASVRFVRALGDARQVARLRKYVRRHRKQLASDVRTWSEVGQALSDADLDARAAAWMADWETREGTTPLMLFPLVLANWKLRRRRQAVAVGRRAVEMTPDGATAYHRLWLAVDAALAGNTAEAAAAVATVDSEPLTEYYRHLHGLLTAAVSPGQASYKTAAGQLREAMARGSFGLRSDRLLRRVFWLLRWRVAKDHGRRATAFWAWLMAALT
jgi:tetratricopeptide (TPR) repeat protein